MTADAAAHEAVQGDNDMDSKPLSQIVASTSRSSKHVSAAASAPLAGPAGGSAVTHPICGDFKMPVLPTEPSTKVGRHVKHKARSELFGALSK